MLNYSILSVSSFFFSKVSNIFVVIQHRRYIFFDQFFNYVFVGFNGRFKMIGIMLSATDFYDTFEISIQIVLSVISL
jgi:hypothetical protein